MGGAGGGDWGSIIVDSGVNGEEGGESEVLRVSALALDCPRVTSEWATEGWRDARVVTWHAGSETLWSGSSGLVMKADWG